MKSINLSLSTLGKIITALSKRDTQKTATKKDKDGKEVLVPPIHIPYRESALTKILYGNIRDGSKTIIIATVSPVG